MAASVSEALARPAAKEPSLLFLTRILPDPLDHQTLPQNTSWEPPA